MLARFREAGDHDTCRRIISLQLGAGCSITATDHGWPVETSMGFSPLEGLILAAKLDEVFDLIGRIQRDARCTLCEPKRPRWPMIVLRTPKGWTGPLEVDGKRTEGSWRSHQVPLAQLTGNPEH